MENGDKAPVGYKDQRRSQQTGDNEERTARGSGGSFHYYKPSEFLFPSFFFWLLLDRYSEEWQGSGGRGKGEDTQQAFSHSASGCLLIQVS